MGTAGQVANDLPALPVFRERRFTGGIAPFPLASSFWCGSRRPTFGRFLRDQSKFTTASALQSGILLDPKNQSNLAAERSVAAFEAGHGAGPWLKREY